MSLVINDITNIVGIKLKISIQKLENVKKELITIKTVLTQKLSGNLVSMRATHESSGNDVVDISLDDIEESLSASLSGKESEVIMKIERALEKIEEGTYGICDISGEEIPMKRLEVMPYATMTVESQRTIEQMNN